MKPKRPHLTATEESDLAGYVKACIEYMNLRHWTIQLLKEPSAKYAAASVNPIKARFWAELQVSEDWSNFDERTRRYTICHELCHLHVEAAWNTIELILPKNDVGRKLFERDMEYAVDALADIIHRALPTYPKMKRQT